MGIKHVYLLENSLKNLMRTKGIVGTFVLSILLAIISFFSFNSYLFFSHIQKQMLESLEEETDLIEIQMSGAPIMAMTIFKIAAFLIFVALILLTIGNMKKSFKQFLLTQQKDYQIMALVGETLSFLTLFYVCQVMLFAITSMAIGSVLGKIIFYEAVIKTIQIGLFSDNVNSFKGNFGLSVIAICLSLIYIFVTTFVGGKKQIQAYES